MFSQFPAEENKFPKHVFPFSAAENKFPDECLPVVPATRFASEFSNYKYRDCLSKDYHKYGRSLYLVFWAYSA